MNKNFIHKDNKTHGQLVLDTPIEVHVRVRGNPVLWTGTREEFESQWIPNLTEVVTEAAPSKPAPYRYFISFTAGAKVGNCVVNCSEPISSIDDIRMIQNDIKKSENLTVDVGILNFRVFDEPFPVLDWAAQVYPAVRQVLGEIRKIPMWAGYFQQENRELIERLVDYEPVGIQEEKQTSFVVDERTRAEAANPGATDKS